MYFYGMLFYTEKYSTNPKVVRHTMLLITVKPNIVILIFAAFPQGTTALEQNCLVWNQDNVFK